MSVVETVHQPVNLPARKHVFLSVYVLLIDHSGKGKDAYKQKNAVSHLLCDWDRINIRVQARSK